MKIRNAILPAILCAGLLAGCSSAPTTSTQATSTQTTSTQTTSTQAEQTSTTETVAAGSTAQEVMAGNVEVTRSSLEYDESSVIDIELTGSGATAAGTGVSIDGATVTITEPGTYRLSGSLDDGQVVVDSAADGLVQVILDGAQITSSTSSALLIADADEAAIILADGTDNSLTDAAQYVSADAETDEPNAALFSTADLTIGGAGSLTVNGRANDGIASKDGLVIASGTVSVTAVDDGIRGKDYLVVDGGTLTVQAGGDALKSDNADDAGTGFILLAGGSAVVEAGDDGLSAANDAVITGGDLSVTAGTATSTETAGKGIVADAALVIAQGSVTVEAADDALHSNGIITVSGATTTLTAGDDGVHADTHITITGGVLDVVESYEGLESANLTLSGGEVSVVAEDDGVNMAGGDGSAAAGPGDQASDFGGRPAGPGGGGGGFEEAGDYLLTITGGQLVIEAEGDGLDSNGTATMSGGTVVVNGPTGNGNGAIDVNGTFELTGGVLMAAGSAGMAETPEATSGQAWVAGSFGGPMAAGTTIAIADDGEVLATFTAGKEFQAFVFSAPGIASGGTYTITTGATATGDSIGGLTRQGTAGAQEAGTVTASGA